MKCVFRSNIVAPGYFTRSTQILQTTKKIFFISFLFFLFSFIPQKNQKNYNKEFTSINIYLKNKQKNSSGLLSYINN